MKVIVVGSKYDGDVWDIVMKKIFVNEVLLFGIVFIFVVIGFEMNVGLVIINWEMNEKYGWGSLVIFL